VTNNAAVLMVCSEAINIANIEEVNDCTKYLESGVALTVIPTDEEANITVTLQEHEGYAPSLWAMLDVVAACEEKEGAIVALEL